MQIPSTSLKCIFWAHILKCNIGMNWKIDASKKNNLAWKTCSAKFLPPQNLDTSEVYFWIVNNPNSKLASKIRMNWTLQMMDWKEEQQNRSIVLCILGMICNYQKELPSFNVCMYTCIRGKMSWTNICLQDIFHIVCGGKKVTDGIFRVILVSPWGVGWACICSYQMLYHQSLFKFFKFGSSVKKSKLHCFSHLAKALVLHEGVTDLRKKTPKNFDGLMFLPRDLKFFGYEVAKQIHVVRFQPTTICI